MKTQEMETKAKIVLDKLLDHEFEMTEDEDREAITYEIKSHYGRIQYILHYAIVLVHIYDKDGTQLGSWECDDDPTGKELSKRIHPLTTAFACGRRSNDKTIIS